MEAVEGSHNPYPVTPAGFLIGSYIAVSPDGLGRDSKSLTPAARSIRSPFDPALHLLQYLQRSAAHKAAGNLDLHTQHTPDHNHHRQWMEVLCRWDTESADMGHIPLASQLPRCSGESPPFRHTLMADPSDGLYRPTLLRTSGLDCMGTEAVVWDLRTGSPNRNTSMRYSVSDEARLALNCKASL